jgi:hypothetical protein
MSHIAPSPPSRSATPALLLPPVISERLRPEIPSLCDEIIAEIARAIPQFRPMVTGEFTDDVEAAVTSNLTTFVDRLVAPSMPAPERDELCRALGRRQAGSDTGLSRLEASFRMGVRISWRRFAPILHRHHVASATQSRLADLMFGYVDEMIALAQEGFLEARDVWQCGRTRLRRNLARALLTGTANEHTLSDLAAGAGWEVLPEATVVLADSGVRIDGAMLDEDVLVDTEDNHDVLIVPGRLDEARLATLRAAADAARLAAGPTVPLTEIPESLRWARRLLVLAETGPVAEEQVLLADDHLLSLWLSSEPWLGARLLERQLAPLDSMTSAQRARMIETLSAWLAAHGDAQRMADALGIHPQTVRYRVRRLRSAFGSAFDDPEWRICTELTLRAMRRHGVAHLHEC